MSDCKQYRVLLIGDICNNHTVRLIKNLASINPNAMIDVFSHRIDSPINSDVESIVRNIYTIRNSSGIMRRIPGLHSITVINSIIKTFKALSVNRYDVVNIHFPLYYYRFILKQLRLMTDTILVTPWGSDVYRVKGLKLLLVKKVYKEADYICGAGNRFNDDVRSIFKVPQKKFVYLDIGSDTIDYILEHNKLYTREDAKKNLGFENKYIISCGYNAAPAQNHLSIINSIHEIKDKLPDNTMLLLPMTYLGSQKYKDTIKSKLEEYEIEYRIFDKFLELKYLYWIRRASDIFIHVQSTDANCASIQEYILCGSKVINGTWLRYKELEPNGELPYFLTPSLEALPKVILNAISDDQTKPSQDVINYITGYGWKSWIIKWNQFYSRCASK